MRLQQSIYPKRKPIGEIRLRVEARGVPGSARVRVTDIQLQAGETASGVVPNPVEVKTTPGRWQFRNGVVNPGLTVVALSNADKAAPVRLLVENANGATRIGSYRFGDVQGTAHADAQQHTATHGWGRAPIVTERQDLTLRTDIADRVHARLMWQDRS